MDGHPRAVPVRLTIKRRRKLEQIIRPATSPQRLVLRARIVLAAAAGAANAAIAQDLGCSTGMARTWRGRFAVRGIPGLFDKPRPGRPEVHGPSARLAVLAVATSVPPDGESQWSQVMIAGHLRERGLAISAATVGRVLAGTQIRPHKIRGWLNRADDPGFWARAGQVCRLYLDPPPGTVLISVDEKTGIQAKSGGPPLPWTVTTLGSLGTGGTPMVTKYQKFGDGYKAEAVKLYRESNQTIAETARNLGLKESTLANWVKKDKDNEAVAVGEAPLTPAERTRIRELEADVRRLNMENAFLKKASAYFASQNL